MKCRFVFPVAALSALLFVGCGDVGTNDDTSAATGEVTSADGQTLGDSTGIDDTGDPTSGSDIVGGDVTGEDIGPNVPPPDPGCIICHGSSVSAAPPKSTVGDTETTKRGVGAHAMHVINTTLASPIACASCHVVPTAIGDVGHMDSARPAEITFGGLALTDGATPMLMGASDPFLEGAVLSCAGTYCHGATLSGGVQHQPVWMKVDGTQKTCDSCHGAPPPAPHPQTTSCEQCHVETAGPNMTIAHPDKHVNGKVEVITTTCSSCHGSDTNFAPPKDTLGETATTSVGVGAHQAHLGATLATPLACSECHTVPSDVGAVGHIDTALPAELTFGARASANGANPNWDHGSASCTSYCHGQTLGGGAATTPVWTQVDGSQKSCGSCHGAPPPPPHTTSTACETCHTETAGPNMTIAHPDKHVNGIVEVAALACNSCHGSASNNGPPKDTLGNTATTFMGVGAHQEHLGATISAPIACTQCHTVPGTITAAGHNDTALPAELAFGALASSAGTTPTWNHTAGTCSTYCHGVTLTGGGTNKAPNWTKVDGTQAACGTCHGVSPSTARHPAVFEDHMWMGKNCTHCHGGETNTAGTAILNATTHVDGVKNVVLQAGGSYNATTKKCSPTCHGTESWK